MKIRVDQIKPNPEQPRGELGDLSSLAASIKERGVILPVAVEGPMPDGFYWLLDGERRWRAAMMAGLETIPAEVRLPNGNDERERLALAVIANMLRQDMSPIEQAQAFRRLIELGYSIAEVAKQVGQHTSGVYLKLRILNLEPEVQELFAKGMLPIAQEVLQSLESIPAEIRVRIATSLAYRGATAKTIKMVCTRISEGKLMQRRPGRKPGKYEVGKQWDAVQQAEKTLPAWIEVAALKTCKACVLYQDASPSICKECPLVVMLGELAKEVKDE